MLPPLCFDCCRHMLRYRLFAAADADAATTLLIQHIAAEIKRIYKESRKRYRRKKEDAIDDKMLVLCRHAMPLSVYTSFVLIAMLFQPTIFIMLIAHIFRVRRAARGSTPPRRPRVCAVRDASIMPRLQRAEQFEQRKPCTILPCSSELLRTRQRAAGVVSPADGWRSAFAPAPRAACAIEYAAAPPTRGFMAMSPPPPRHSARRGGGSGVQECAQRTAEARREVRARTQASSGVLPRRGKRAARMRRCEQAASTP